MNKAQRGTPEVSLSRIQYKPFYIITFALLFLITVLDKTIYISDPPPGFAAEDQAGSRERFLMLSLARVPLAEALFSENNGGLSWFSGGEQKPPDSFGNESDFLIGFARRSRPLGLEQDLWCHT